jgi:hypothetical protein
MMTGVLGEGRDSEPVLKPWMNEAKSLKMVANGAQGRELVSSGEGRKEATDEHRGPCAP